MVKETMKLLDILAESMADGGAFKAFTDAAIAKQEVQANEGLNLIKKPVDYTGEYENVREFIRQHSLQGKFAEFYSDSGVTEENWEEYAQGEVDFDEMVMEKLLGPNYILKFIDSRKGDDGYFTVDKKHNTPNNHEINENETRGEIRKKADILLDKLHALATIHLVDDVTDRIKQQVDLINNSGIDWDHDVVKSVREKYHGLMGFVNNKMDKIKR
jgi:hypothetical protein